MEFNKQRLNYAKDLKRSTKSNTKLAKADAKIAKANAKEASRI